jgi:hypothetical protein
MGFPSLPMGPFHGSLLYTKHWSTTDCSVADVREWRPRRKSWTTPWYQERRDHNIKPTWSAESIVTPPIMRDAKRQENQDLRVMTDLSWVCFMSMRSKMWPNESMAPDGLKYLSICLIVSKPFPSKQDSSTNRSEIGDLT